MDGREEEGTYVVCRLISAADEECATRAACGLVREKLSVSDRPGSQLTGLRVNRAGLDKFLCDPGSLFSSTSDSVSHNETNVISISLRLTLRSNTGHVVRVYCSFEDPAKVPRVEANRLVVFGRYEIKSGGALPISRHTRFLYRWTFLEGPEAGKGHRDKWAILILPKCLRPPESASFYPPSAERLSNKG
jgi:hypothetical protein